MKFYTQDEFNAFNDTAKKSFKKESDSQLELFSKFINNLELDLVEPSEKINNAFLEKERIEHNLKEFIYINYPKSEEVLINGLVYYTIETVIFFNLIVDSFGETCKELERLYQDFFEKNFPHEPTA